MNGSSTLMGLPQNIIKIFSRTRYLACLSIPFFCMSSAWGVVDVHLTCHGTDDNTSGLTILLGYMRSPDRPMGVSGGPSSIRLSARTSRYETGTLYWIPEILASTEKRVSGWTTRPKIGDNGVAKEINAAASLGNWIMSTDASSFTAETDWELSSGDDNQQVLATLTVLGKSGRISELKHNVNIAGRYRCSALQPLAPPKAGCCSVS